MQRLYLHIGMHKTGTTSIQGWMQRRPDILAKHKLVFMDRALHKVSHVEVALSVLRDDVGMTALRARWGAAPDLFEQTKDRIAQALKAAAPHDLIISSEVISFMREQSEIDRLKALLPANIEIIPIVVVREKQDWLASYRHQLAKSPNDGPIDPTSPRNVAPDSWVLDHARLVSLFTSAFPTTRVLDYCDNVLPVFAAELGIVKFKGTAPRLNVSAEQRARGIGV